jgi:hypothetical protein
MASPSFLGWHFRSKVNRAFFKQSAVGGFGRNPSLSLSRVRRIEALVMRRRGVGAA